METTQDNSKYTIQEAICEIMLQDKSKTWTFEELTNELGKVKKNFTLNASSTFQIICTLASSTNTMKITLKFWNQKQQFEE
jgi:hypothetical protein